MSSTYELNGKGQQHGIECCMTCGTEIGNSPCSECGTLSCANCTSEFEGICQGCRVDYEDEGPCSACGAEAGQPCDPTALEDFDFDEEDEAT